MNLEKELKRLQKKKEGCENCNGHGYLMVPTTAGCRFEDCECVKSISKELNMIESGIPKRYWNWDFKYLTNDFKKVNEKQYKYLKNYLDNFQEKIEASESLWFSSPPGMAKSSIISYFLRKATTFDYTAHFTRASSLLSKKFEAMSNYEAKEYINFIINDVDVLALEELEKVYLAADSSMPNMLFSEMLADLYDSNKTIYITSNATKKEAFQLFPLFIQDRLETVKYIPLTGKVSGRRNQ